MIRAASIPQSCVHEVFERVGAHEVASGAPAIRLHVGEPGFRPPRAVCEAAVRALRDGRSSYTGAAGLLELRVEIARKLRARNGVEADVDEIFVCPGSAQGLSAVMQSLAEEGAEMLLPSLHWPVHLQQCIMSGFRPVFYPLEDDFSLSAAGVERSLTERSRVLLVNSPANPTGRVCKPEVFLELLELARRHRLAVICDEAYEDFVYEGDGVTMAALERGLDERRRCVFSVFSFSKSYAMTGYRLGYVVAPHGTAAERLLRVQEASIVAPSTPVQFAGIAALRECPGSPSQARHRLLKARSGVLPTLIDLGLLRELPQGGWYVVIDVGATGLAGTDFVRELLAESNVALAPAEGFSRRTAVGSRLDATDPAARHLVRLAFCGAPDALTEGIRRLAVFVRSRVAREEVSRYGHTA